MTTRQQLSDDVLLIQGHILDALNELPRKSVRCIVTSPPYWGLRAYGTQPQIWANGHDLCVEHAWGSVTKKKNRADYAMDASGKQTSNRGSLFETAASTCAKCGAWRGELGGEPTPELYVEHLVQVFRAVWDVLADDGTLWLNLGDSFAGGKGQSGTRGAENQEGRNVRGESLNRGYQTLGSAKQTKPTDDLAALRTSGLKPKDLVGIPWRVAFALQANGWYLRSDIIWCLSGGTMVYARTQKGDMPMTIKDMARLDPSTVKLWNGEKWTQVLGWSKSKRRGDELELVLRSGERVSCTPTHKFPTKRGLLGASEIVVGDILLTTHLPEPELPRDSEHIGLDAAWLAGLYIAEGSRSEDTIQISGHVKEESRWERVKQIAESYGGSATRTIEGNGQSIRVYGKVLNALIDSLVSGKTAKDKGFAPVCWRYSNSFLGAMLAGYLSGDGHWDSDNNRWRLGFTRNYNLERDLRTLTARLGFNLTLNLSSVEYNGQQSPTFRGEIRFGDEGRTIKSQVVEIRKSRCRDVYDIGVADEPHLFALASGILTHNSKPNPMPESVRDRPTKSHEYIFLLSKSRKYYYDANAVREGNAPNSVPTGSKINRGSRTRIAQGNAERSKTSILAPGTMTRDELIERYYTNGRNRRSVWTVTTKPYKGAHFATFPPDLIEPCILAGSAPGDIVLDPFGGSGTTGQVAIEEGRKYIGIELQPSYIDLTIKRLVPVLKRIEKQKKQLSQLSLTGLSATSKKK